MRREGEVWRGGVNSWDCDEMGHMNTRFYVARAAEALATFFALLGMPGLFSPLSPATLVLRDMHIRFHREAREGTSLSIAARVLAQGRDGADILLSMFDGNTSELKATFRMEIAHVAAGDPGRALDWPQGFAERAAQWSGALPREAEPRGAQVGPVETRASLALADELGLTRIGMGTITPERADAFGRMAAQGFMASVSDGIRSLTAPLRDIVVAHAEKPPVHYGGAVLETRIVHRHWPRIGDCYEIRSGLQRVDDTVQSLIHWMLDPVTGRVYATMQSIAIVFDIDARKAVRATARAKDELQPMTVAGLDL